MLSDLSGKDEYSLCCPFNSFFWEKHKEQKFKQLKGCLETDILIIISRVLERRRDLEKPHIVFSEGKVTSTVCMENEALVSFQP